MQTTEIVPFNRGTRQGESDNGPAKGSDAALTSVASEEDAKALDECARQIRQIRLHMARLELVIGRELLAARNLLLYGEVEKWAKVQGFGFSPRSIRNYIALAKFEQLVLATVADLDGLLGVAITLTAAYHLGTQDPDDREREEIVAAVGLAAGEQGYILDKAAAKSLCPSPRAGRTPLSGTVDRDNSSVDPANGSVADPVASTKGLISVAGRIDHSAVSDNPVVLVVPAATSNGSSRIELRGVNHGKVPVGLTERTQTGNPADGRVDQRLEFIVGAWIEAHGPYLFTPFDIVALVTEKVIDFDFGYRMKPKTVGEQTDIVSNWLHAKVGAFVAGYRLHERRIEERFPVYQLIPVAEWRGGPIPVAA